MNSNASPGWYSNAVVIRRRIATRRSCEKKSFGVREVVGGGGGEGEVAYHTLEAVIQFLEENVAGGKGVGTKVANQ